MYVHLSLQNYTHAPNMAVLYTQHSRTMCVHIAFQYFEFSQYESAEKKLPEQKHYKDHPS